ncbi:anthranilate synthase family protein [Streptomyces sp. NPDC002888]|uniref:anthranilate synthase family protein n=1 Tax=Streptomyces sp. NPDC002888 TaxID=3364668 RepID=UPI003673DAAE
MSVALLDRILGPETPPFALLHRPESGAAGRVEVLLCEATAVDRLADLPVSATPATGRPQPGHELLVAVPYRQIAERGFDCPDDKTPLVALRVTEQAQLALDDFVRAVPDVSVALREPGFDIDAEEYAELVRRVLADEIGSGQGANFVLKRSFLATVEGYTTATALAVFRRLLQEELGAYWTFVVHTGDRTLVGASPERHISVAGGTATMNPISGTYRYPAEGVSIDGVLGFLGDRKESDELYMVLDEELKMMGRVCERGGRVIGPRLKAMSRLAHTEYLIEGRTRLDARSILRETMFAPTVTGSPLESACRVIARYEPAGRGYYSGALALIGRDAAGRQTLDSAIVIRTADIDPSGRLRIDVGATLVRHSDPRSEAEETRAKAEGMLAAFGFRPAGERGRVATPAARTGEEWAAVPAVRDALHARNHKLARFWLDPGRDPAAGPEAAAGRRALVIDCEDTFTSMLAHQLGSLGLEVEVVRFDEQPRTRGHDLVVLGPGPGDPQDHGHPKIRAMRRLAARVREEGTALLAVCLGHQVLASVLGMDVVRRPVPHQGVRLPVDLFGRTEWCGFYNTFAARSDHDRWDAGGGWGTAEVSRDPLTGEVHALRGRGFASLQFHPESVLTENGVRILGELVDALTTASSTDSALPV